MGNDTFAIPSLQSLLENNYKVSAVVTNPDKPQGRGLKLLPQPLRAFALEKNLTVWSPSDLKSPEFISELKKLKPDIIVVVAFTILPEQIFSLPALGTINLHPSLLPKYRGAAPIRWALINGEKETGVTTFFIEKKVDAGNIILQKKVEIFPDETYGELSERLSKIGAEVLIESLKLVQEKNFTPLKQDENLSSKAPKIKKEDCKIEWSQEAKKIKNLIRGLSPEPGAFTTYQDKIVKIYQAQVLEEKNYDANFGEIVEASDKNGIVVKTRRGSLKILSIQLEGKKMISGEDFVRGYRVKVGEKFI